MSRYAQALFYAPPRFTPTPMPMRPTPLPPVGNQPILLDNDLVGLIRGYTDARAFSALSQVDDRLTWTPAMLAADATSQTRGAVLTRQKAYETIDRLASSLSPAERLAAVDMLWTHAPDPGLSIEIFAAQIVGITKDFGLYWEKLIEDRRALMRVIGEYFSHGGSMYEYGEWCRSIANWQYRCILGHLPMQRMAEAVAAKLVPVDDVLAYASTLMHEVKPWRMVGVPASYILRSFSSPVGVNAWIRLGGKAYERRLVNSLADVQIKAPRFQELVREGAFGPF